MTRPPLLPGAAPARLLLTLWEAQARGERWVDCWGEEGWSELARLGYIAPAFLLSKGFRLTEAGRLEAQRLEGSTP